MGEVYRARDTKLNRDVAIKILPELFAADPDRLARFTREAQTLAALNHANVAHIYGVIECPPALVMEFADGEDLSAIIARGSLPVDEAIGIARQIAEALEAAHEQGIVHRDLKPANVKVKADGTVKVLDFGLAKAMDPGGTAETSSAIANSPTLTARATAMGLILGTAAYMAPEQARGKAVDKRADIWAFGVVLFEMLTGRQTFAGDTISDVMAAVMKDDPDWSRLPAGLAPQIVRLLRRCLVKDPKQRLRDIGDARLLLDDTDAPAPSLVDARLHSTRRVIGLASTLALIVAISTMMAMRSLRPATPAAIVTHLDLVTPPTSDPFSFALSPDGRQVAFVAGAEGTSRLWVRSFDSGDARPLAGTEGASYPFWSPDGRAIGFFAQNKLMRVDVAGGVPLALTNVGGARGGTWNQDGVIVFAPRSSSSGLTRIAATGGTPVVLTHPAPGQSHRWPQFLPDGRRFLFLSAYGAASTHGVYLGSLDGQEPTRLLAGETAAMYASPGYLLRVIDGVLVAHRFNPESGVVNPESVPLAQPVGMDDGTFRGAFSVSSTALAHRAGGAARRQLVWLDRAGKVTGTVGPPDDASLASPELAPGGRRIAVTRTVLGNDDIYISEIAGGGPHRFTFDPAIESGAVWSPDASRIVFHSDRSGKFDLFEKVASGASDEQPFLVSPQNKVAWDWSPDGRFLLYSSEDPTTGYHLWGLSVGDRKSFPVRTNAVEREGQFSPDGRWVAYVSNEGGIDEVYIQPFPGLGAKQQASTNGGVDPRWGRDGRELFYVAPDGKLMAVAIHVDADGAVNVGPPIALFQTRLPTGANISAGFRSRPQYAVAPDGRFLMNVTVDDNVVAPISIVLNWATAPKK